MNIYIAHATSYDFTDELYAPLRQLEADENVTFFFPHAAAATNSKDTLSECDFVIAEVSYPSTGMGIELGWANDLKKPIVCLSKTGSTPSTSLKFISDTFVSYASPGELVDRVRHFITLQENTPTV